MVNELQGLTPRERDRLAKILARLSSNFEGERAAAALLATEFVSKHRLKWTDVTRLLTPEGGTAAPAAPERDAAPASPKRSGEAAWPKQDRRQAGQRGWMGYNRRRRAGPLGQALSDLA